MAKNDARQKALNELVAWFFAQPWKTKLIVVALVGVVLAALYFFAGTPQTPTPSPPPGDVPIGEPSAELLDRGEYLFCWWNVENFFDDKVDGWGTDPDKEYDAWFAGNPDLLNLKLDNLVNALIPLNGGIGPDILACCEVEDSRDKQTTPGALLLLRDRLNARISDPGLRYREVVWRQMAGGRAIIAAILTRLPVDPVQTRLVYRNERILQGVIRVRGHDLVVIASHWTSRLTDKTGDRRAAYGDAIYGHVAGLYARDRDVPVIVAGDFNDPPESPSVERHLWATTDLAQVRASGAEPYLFNLMRQPSLAGKGTILAERGGGLEMFDQVVVSPGMVRPGSRGWTVDVDSVAIITAGTTYKPRTSTQLRPLRFGSPSTEGNRGTSDHLPVTVKLRLPR